MGVFLPGAGAVIRQENSLMSTLSVAVQGEFCRRKRTFFELNVYPKSYGYAPYVVPCIAPAQVARNM